MDIINVLSIGNSFSQDAQRYLHDLAMSEGVKLETVNLFIGGCPLERHFRNMKGNRREYALEVNGHFVAGFMTSLEEVLTARNWDYITLQQASSFSYIEKSYYPYINELTAYIRELCPKANILIHQTWGYANGSTGIANQGFASYDEMFAQVEECYHKAAKAVNADGILPSGAAFQYALQHGIETVHRDSAHASLGVGRFILALVWYYCMTGKDISGVRFRDFEEDVTEQEYKIAIESAIFAVTQVIYDVNLKGKCRNGKGGIYGY